MKSTAIPSVLAALTLISPAFGATETKTLSQIYAARSTWEHMDWDDAEHSAPWTADEWEPKAKAHGGDGFIFERDSPLKIAGHQFTARIGDGTRSDSEAHSTWMDGNFGNCTEAIKALTDAYGPPSITNDLHLVTRITADIAMNFDMTRAQWNMGATRATAICTAPFSKSDSARVSVSYTRPDKSKTLLPVVALICRDIKFWEPGVGGDGSNMDDLLYWIDPFSSVVLGPTHESIASDAVLSETELKFSKQFKRKVGEQEQQGEMRFTVSRITGSLRISTVIGDSEVSHMTGRCEKQGDIETVF